MNAGYNCESMRRYKFDKNNSNYKEVDQKSDNECDIDMKEFGSNKDDNFNINSEEIPSHEINNNWINNSNIYYLVAGGFLLILLITIFVTLPMSCMFSLGYNKSCFNISVLNESISNEEKQNSSDAKIQDALVGSHPDLKSNAGNHVKNGTNNTFIHFNSTVQTTEETTKTESTKTSKIDEKFATPLLIVATPTTTKYKETPSVTPHMMQDNFIVNSTQILQTESNELLVKVTLKPEQTDKTSTQHAVNNEPEEEDTSIDDEEAPEKPTTITKEHCVVGKIYTELNNYCYENIKQQTESHQIKYANNLCSPYLVPISSFELLNRSNKFIGNTVMLTNDSKCNDINLHDHLIFPEIYQLLSCDFSCCCAAHAKCVASHTEIINKKFYVTSRATKHTITCEAQIDNISKCECK